MRFAQSGSEDTALRGDCPFAHLIELWQQLAQRPGDTGWAAVSAQILIDVREVQSRRFQRLMAHRHLQAAEVETVDSRPPEDRGLRPRP